MKKRIKEICDFVSRGSAPAYVDESGNKVMNQATFSKGWIDESNIRYSSKADNAANIHRGDLLMASTGGGVLGKIVYFDKLDENFYADSHVTIMRNSKNKNSMKFLYYYFYTRYDEINATMAKGSTNQTELQRNSLLAYEIDIPDFGTQLRIVDYLDSKTAAIDSQISVLEKKREAYERLKQSVINRAVTRGLEENVPLKPSGVDWIGMIPEHWEVLRMKDVCVLSPTVESKNTEAEVSFLPMEGLRLGRLTTSVEICRNVYKKYTAFQEGDLLIAKVTPCFENGNISLAEGLTNGEGYGSSEIFVLRVKENCINKFLFYVALSKPFKDGACATMCGVGGLKRISPEFMKCRAIGFPPIAEQQQIIEYLDEKCIEINRAIENTNKQIDAYKRLKRSLINEVVTGQRAV